MSNINTIKNRGPVEYFELILTESVTPGQVLEQSSASGAKLSATSGAPNDILVMPEQSLLGSGVGVAITSGNLVTVMRPVPGAVINGLTRASNGASGGTPMTVDQSGFWANASSAGVMNNSGLSLTNDATMTDVASGTGLVSGINQNLANLAAIVASLVVASQTRGVCTSARITTAGATNSGLAGIRIV